MRYLLKSLLLLTLLSGCATNPVTGKQDLVLMSEQDEINLGKQASQEVLQQYHIYNDIELQNYVQYVGSKVAAKSHRPNLNYRFTVVDSPEVNAFALPGGYVYITRGLMAYLNSEAELAAVLGHEIGHVTARHAVRQQSAAQLTSLGAALGTAFIPGLNNVGGQQLTNMFGSALLSGYGREQELEADKLGAEYLGKAGYDPNAMMDTLRILKNQELFEMKLAKAEGRQPHIYHGLFASHPDNDTRLKEVIANARNVKAVASPLEGRTEYLQRIDGLTFGEGTDQGIVRGRDFYQGNLGFALRLPAGWKIKNGSNGQFAAAAPGSSAVIQLATGIKDPRLPPRDYMLQRLGLTRLSNEADLKIHGLPAHTAMAVVNTMFGQRLARITVIYHGNLAIILGGYTKTSSAIGQYDGAFLDTARSFRPLTPAEKAVATRSRHIHIVRADKSTTMDKLAAKAAIEKFPEQQLRLLNALYPNGDPKAGELIKTVED